jgi:hypothetical protein
LKLLAGSIAIGLWSPSAAGSLKHQVDQNDGDILTCADDGKVTFGCGRLGVSRLAQSAGEAAGRLAATASRRAAIACHPRAEHEDQRDNCHTCRHQLDRAQHDANGTIDGVYRFAAGPAEFSFPVSMRLRRNCQRMARYQA